MVIDKNSMSRRWLAQWQVVCAIPVFYFIGVWFVLCFFLIFATKTFTFCPISVLHLPYRQLKIIPIAFENYPNSS